jgi:hypothetical protein
MNFFEKASTVLKTFWSILPMKTRKSNDLAGRTKDKCILSLSYMN